MTEPVPGPTPAPEPDRDTQTTLDAATTPGNTPVADPPPDPPAGQDDPTVGDRADPALRRRPRPPGHDRQG